MGVLAGLVIAAAGCSTEDPSPIADAPPPSSGLTLPGAEPYPDLDADMLAVGADLYVRHCSSCHGSDLKGASNWQVMNPDGSFPPPPQDSTGHTWHHGDDLLVEIVLEGSEFPQSRMPAFGDLLSEMEVLSILEFFKSTWGPQERAVQWEVTLRERG